VKRIVKFRKIGNSLMITIPRDLAEDLKWKENDDLLLESEPLEKETIFRGPKMLKAGKVE
jgi:antitoxin component of MazEF toxin-antitoxin module